MAKIETENRPDSLSFFLQRQTEYRDQLVPITKKFVQNHFGKDYSGPEYDTIEAYAAGGKFLREGFAIEAYRGTAERKSMESMLRTALAMTMLQAGSLMQDDVYDRSRKRHDVDTMHVVIGELFKKEKNGTTGASQYGQKQAILISQKIALAGYDAINESDFAEELKHEAKDEWKRDYDQLVSGERRDLFLGEFGKVKEMKTDDWTKLIDEKTTPLFTGAINFGLIFSRKVRDEELTSTFRRFAKKYSGLLQGTDDYIGIFGNPQETGKSNTDDIVYGAANLGLILTYQVATNGQRKTLDSIVGKESLQTKDEDRRAVIEIMAKTGATNNLQAQLDTFAADAITDIGKIPQLDPESKEYFIGATIATRKREK